jgi:hypothetical protein
MLEAAANANLVSTISLKRNTPFLQPPTSGPADYPSYRDVARYPSKETMGARRMDNDHRGLLHLIAELGCMPQRYPDPDRGHCWALLDSILLFLSELVDAGQRALCIAEIRNPVAAVQTQPRRLPTSVPTAPQ